MSEGGHARAPHRASTYATGHGTSGWSDAAERTPAERANDAMQVAAREVDALEEAIRRARDAHENHDVDAWARERETIAKQIARADAALASTREANAQGSDGVAHRLAEAKAAAAAPELATRPLGYQPIATEERILDILQPRAAANARSIDAQFDAKEEAILAELSRLSAADARLLLARLTSPRADDPIAAAMKRLSFDRRQRLTRALTLATRPDLRRGSRTLAPEQPPAGTAPTSRAADLAERNAPAAARERELPRAKRGALGTYLDRHGADVRAVLVQRLAAVPWHDPIADVPFTRHGQAAFGRALATGAGARADDEPALRDLVMPHDLDVLLRENVDLAHPGWSPQFGAALAQLVERVATDALHFRLGPRIRHALSTLGRAPTADDIVPGHPIDALVIPTLMTPGVLDFSHVAQTQPEGTAAAAPEISVRWLGREHPELWNCAQVSEAGLPRERYAAALWGDPEKTTMAAAIEVYGDVVRVAPGRARQLIHERYPGAYIGRDDPSEAMQIDALARTDLTRGDAATKQVAETVAPPTVAQVMQIEHDIGQLLDAIRDRVHHAAIDGALSHAYAARADRVALLAGSDEATRVRWLPVLQFQHTQLLTLRPRIDAAALQLAPLTIPDAALDANKRARRDGLRRRIGLLLQAADLSDLRDQSTRLVAILEGEDREAQRDQLDAAQRGQEAGVADARDARESQYTKQHHAKTGEDPAPTVPADADEVAEQLASYRRDLLAGDGSATARDEQKMLVQAGTVALKARINAAHVRLDHLYDLAVQVYGDPERLRRLIPAAKTFPDLIALVNRYLDETQRTWDDTYRSASKGAHDENAEWQAKATALAAAQDAFARIAGDVGVVEFIQAAGKHIQDQRVRSALVSFAATLLITVATGAGAAWLGQAARAAIAGETASMVRSGFAIAADVLTNVTINTAVQRAMSGGDGSVGWMILENLLMEGFTRNLLAPLRRAEETAKNVARQYARLPNLTAAEREALLSVNLEARNLMGELVGGMAAQWAARHIVTRVRRSVASDAERDRMDEDDVSESFAMTVLQQGAAIGLGKFFGGKIHAWNESRKLMARSQLGSLPDVHAYLAARDAFYRQAEALANNPSPDPSEETHLLSLDAALIAQEQAILAAHGAAPTTAEESAPGAAPVVGRALGGEIAASVPGVRYEAGGSFKIASGKGEITVRIRRGSDHPRIVHDGAEVIIEIPRGLDEASLRAAVARQLEEVRGVGDAPHDEIAAQVAEELAPGRVEVTAAAVPGSMFKGKGEHPGDPAKILAAGDRALDEVVNARAEVGQPAEHAHVDERAKSEVQEIAKHTHVIHLEGGEAITIRVAVAPLEHQNVARSVMNPTKEGRTSVDRVSGEHPVVTEVDVHGRYVIQLSDKMDAGNVRRAVAHEVAEILARRALGASVPGLDMLRPGGIVTGPLSPHDHGRIAEINELARELHHPDDADAARASRAEHVRDELTTLVEDMGLRKGAPGAEERYERMKPELTADARAALDSARANEATLPEADSKRLGWTREDAGNDREAQQKWERAHALPHEMPHTESPGRIATKAEREALAEGASRRRAARSAATVAMLRAEASTGVRPKWRIQLGGGAALAARDPGALLIDANGRWAVDSSKEIAQTAQQLDGLKAAGIGDPYEFAAPNERVPIEAIRFWQDSIAAQGPVVDGRAELGVDADGTLIVTIQAESGPPIVVEVVGIPVVATGFGQELAAGAPRGKTTRKALVELDKALGRLERDPEVGAQAKEARAKIQEIKGTEDGDASRALAELPAPLRDKLAADPRNTPTLEQLSAQGTFEDLRKNDPGHVLYGDEANRLTPEQARTMNRVLIAGTGGTGISAAEIILNQNPNAHVMMVGKDPPAGLLENDQFRSVVARYGTDRLRADLHVPAQGSDGGRFDLEDGYILDAAKAMPGGGYDAGATPIPGNTKALPAEAFQGDTYIAALGRAPDVPAPVAALASEAERNGRGVAKMALLDSDGLYVGYRVKIKQPNGSEITIDVTGAASRSADASKMPRGHAQVVTDAFGHDAPPESGSFAGAYAPSATQALRYASAERAGDLKEAPTAPARKTSP